MREITSKINYLDSFVVESPQKTFVHDRWNLWGIKAILESILVKILFGGKEGVIYFFPIKNSILPVRVILEKLRQSGFVESYGDGLPFNKKRRPVRPERRHHAASRLLQNSHAIP